ncbi:MAG: hypothetical protein H8E44_14580 [Planctomycetes bacterium]|nr:hypothetical protein [Planctomycetota bacterium]MBL7039903.1 hypothetical protein [Pirellulaceae bacterium]
MKKTGIAICLSMGLILAGCPRAEGPVGRPDKMATDAPGPVAEPEPVEAEPATATEPEPAPKAPAYTAEQIAAAIQLATDLGVAIKEDGDGNVIGIDTAANRSWVKDAWMEVILAFPKLASLTLEGPDITDQLVPRIAKQTPLTSLALRNTMIGDKGISQFTTLTSLKVIDLRLSSQVSDASMHTLAKLSDLRAVRLSGVTKLTDAGIGTLLALPQLTELDLRNCREVTKSGIEALAKKDTLRTLKIGGPEVTDDVLAAVTGMEQLATLSLDNCDITDAGVAGLDRLSLVDLTIYQASNVTDTGLAVLANYDNLQRLTLRDAFGTKGTALAKLPHPEKLVALNMSQSGISDAEVVHLAGMTHLESLNLSETRLTDQAVDALAKLTSLKEMVLTQTGIGEEGMNRLRTALPDCSIRSD